MTERNEFMRFIPQEQLEQIALDAKTDGLEAASLLAESELQRRREVQREEIARWALSMGVYDASIDEAEPQVEHTDSQWAVELENIDDNPDIFRSED